MNEKLTPAMKQYWEIKRQLPDCIILFRMGDFYETFYDDAKVVSQTLQIVLTSRGKGDKKAPLAGIPYHALDAYLHKLIKAGYKVAIVEQLEDPKKAKGIVKRGVVRIVTPGTVIEDTMLEAKSNNYTMTFYNEKEDGFGLAVCDFSTGEFYATKVSKDELWDEVERFSPREIVLPEKMRGSLIEKEVKKRNIVLNYITDAAYWKDNAKSVILNHFNVYSLDAVGIKDKNVVGAIGALLKYFYDTQFKSIEHIRKVTFYDPKQRMIIDSTTLANLEIVKNLVDGTTRNTLLSVMDKTITPMGSRKLRSWLVSPLIDKKKIEKRLGAVEYFYNNRLLCENVQEALKNIYDIQRIATRIGMGNVTPKELLSLKRSLEMLPVLKNLLKDVDNEEIKSICNLSDLEDIRRLITEAIVDDPPSSIRDGGMIKKGFSKELDEIREIVENSREWLAKLEEEERRRTGIKNLKIGYNKVIGYYIEVPKSQVNKLPVNYIRKSTQKNNERFITPELKEKEALILTANEQIITKEIEIYTEIIEKIKEKINYLQSIGDKLATLDVYLSFAKIAHENGYVKPEIVSDNIIDITGGRHPVVEKMVDSFIPNDVRLDSNNRIMIITGPNMAGKSTVMRQVALIILMAQAGSFVPAEKAKIGIVDRVFTRVGARDDISRGQSTFMMEMVETANILNNATDRSFVVLDEIGRGTSTYDGMALAWAIIEYIENKIKCRTMFATHYHLLNLLALKYKDIVNYNIGVKEENGKVIFLHKLLPGGTDKSYGIHVAKLAGLPKEVIIRAMEIASMLEQTDHVHREALSNLTLDILKDEDKLEKLEDKFNITIEEERELEKREKNMKQTTLFMFEE